MMESSNPYTIDSPIQGQEQFIGRMSLVHEVERWVQDPHCNILLLSGQRKSGKTSFLLQLERTFAAKGDFLPVYFDLCSAALLPLQDILHLFAEKIADALGIDAPEKYQFERHGRFFCDTFMPKAVAALQQTSLILLFDEFDMPQQARQEKNRFTFLSEFPEWMRGVEGVQCVFALGRRPEELSLNTLSAFQDVPVCTMSLMTQQETELMIHQSERHGNVIWSQDAVERIWYWTQGHPYVTQLICHTLWESLVGEMARDARQKPPQKKRKKGSSAIAMRVIANGVDTLIDRALEEGTTTLQWYWEGFPHAERLILAAMAEAGQVTIPLNDAETLLNKHNIRLAVKELELALQTLIRWDILHETKGGLKITLPFLRTWVTFEKSLQQAKEEFEREKTLAEQLFQAGKDAFKSGQSLEAEQHLREALRINPYHLHARLLLGPVLVGTGNPAAAVEEVNIAYQLDPRLSKSVMVNTLLALAKKQPESQRIATYSRILEIDPKKSSARDSLNELAESAIQKGNLTRALTVYQQLRDQEHVKQVKTFWQKRRRKRSQKHHTPEAKTIVVIEDSQYARTLLAAELKKHGFNVLAAADAESGHIQIATHKPDLIVLDLNLPNIEGGDLGVMLRGAKETASIPMIIFSVSPEEEIRQVLELTGAEGYVRKGQNMKVCINELIQKIGEIIP